MSLSFGKASGKTPHTKDYDCPACRGTDLCSRDPRAAARIDELKERIAELEAQTTAFGEQWRYWADRAQKAEAEVERFRRAIETALSGRESDASALDTLDSEYHRPASRKERDDG